MSTCVFCRIIAGTEPRTLVREWPDAVAFLPLDPVTGGHVLVVPRVHVADFTQSPEVSAAVAYRAAQLAAELGCELNLVTSKGRAATQTVFHLHYHLVPRVAGDGLPLPWTPQQAAARAEGIDPTARIVVSSFGYLHGPPPTADLVVDLRPRLRDPHTSPELRELTGHDMTIKRMVRATPGYHRLVAGLKGAVEALAGAGERPVHVAVGCAGGRHRSVTVAEDLAWLLSEAEPRMQVRHVDIEQPVVVRPKGGER